MYDLSVITEYRQQNLRCKDSAEVKVEHSNLLKLARLLKPRKLVLANGLLIPLGLVDRSHLDCSPGPKNYIDRIQLFNRRAI